MLQKTNLQIKTHKNFKLLYFLFLKDKIKKIFKTIETYILTQNNHGQI